MSDIDYGPQADAVHAIEERYDKLTADERQRLYELRDDAFWEAWSVVHGGRARQAGLCAARDALRGRLFGFVGDCTACGAALAVLLRHTIGQDGFTQAHYDALTKPWVTVTGTPAHPDDEGASGSCSSVMATDLLSAVLEAYTPEGVVIWLTNWVDTDEEHRVRMAHSVMQEWSRHPASPDDLLRSRKR